MMINKFLNTTPGTKGYVGSVGSVLVTQRLI